MAQLEVSGFDAFAADLEAAKNLTEAEQYAILNAGGEVVQEAMRGKLQSLGLVDTGRLAESIEVVRKTGDGGPYVLIEPQGKHHTYHGWGTPKGRSKGRGKGAAKTATAGEVGFVFEYGATSRGIEAKHWMEQAVEQSADETAEAMQAAFNEALDAKGGGQ